MLVRIACALTMCLVSAVRGYMPDQLLELYGPNGDYGTDRKHLAKELLTECIAMRSDAGIYQVDGSGEQSACGIFLVGGMETQVEIEFLSFGVECEDGGVVGILDGWEQNGSIFPPVEDMGKNGIRHKTFCGANRPKQLFRSSGNMALIQYRLPAPGVGFLIRVSFPLNPKPCNAVSFLPEGKLILRNYGQGVNCSVMMMYPEKLTFTYVNVGARDLKSTALQLGGVVERTVRTCAGKSKEDMVEVRGGGNFEMRHMTVFQELCGFHPLMRETHSVMCGATMVRLVSSGHFDNTVIVENALLEEDELTADTHMCTPEEMAV